MRNPKESSYCPEATVGLMQRTVSCPQDRLRTGGPKTGDSLASRHSTTPLNNSIYDSNLQLLSTTPLYRSQLPITVEDPPTTSTPTTAVYQEYSAYRAENSEKYRFKNSNMYCTRIPVHLSPFYFIF